ncbi:hypothetical protein CcaCcLH18_05753 [Colletotrichum camelliae]|nr:hypothetical protein CcaCcLH18_05753 [Colletotrichum camelliae]
MNTIATRRQLPLLLLLRTPPPPQWHRQPVRFHWVGARPLEMGRQGKDGKKKKEAQSSIFQEMFPEEGDKNTPYRQPEDEDDTKVRIVTSTHVDKSEVTEWRAAVAAKEERRRKHLEKRSAALSAIPDLLVPKEKGKKRKRKKGKTNPKSKPEDKAEDKLEDAPKNTQWGLGSSVIPSRGSAPKTEEQAETPKTARGPPSLYKELFKDDAPPKPTDLAEDRHVNHGDLQAWIDSLPRGDSAGPADKEKSSLLILSNASANLGESDFYRVGPQGQHLDGWGVSISKVMQAYDHNTLQPLGRYFILFVSHHAAALYQSEAQRRHNAARLRRQSAAAPLAAAPEPGDPAIFTLAAPSNAPLSLHLYKLNKAAEKRLESFSVQGLLSMTPDPPPRACSPVVLSIEGGTLDQRSLSQWIRRDARDRGLGWPVQHIRPYFPPRIHQRGPLEEPSEDDYHWDEDSAPKIVDPDAVARKTMDETARSALFVLSFPDAHEARRFVRAWHNKELVRSRGESVTLRTHFVW